MRTDAMAAQGSDYNEKADVYSFGIILWQIFTCEPLYADTEYASPRLSSHSFK
jgi:hypothetical protein